MQTLYIATNWNPIYWNTSCLIVNSGALDPEAGGQTDYGKVAKALGQILAAGIKLSLPDINHSAFGFKPDVQNNQILYGMKAMLNVGDEVINNIIQNRSYTSIKDYYYKNKPNKQAMISLIKGGAFDNIENRNFAMAWFIWETCDKKKRLTLQNMTSLIKYKLLPEDTQERITARQIYEFNRYLKTVCKKTSQNYILDERAINFLIKINKDNMIKNNNDYKYLLSINLWDKFYQSWMDVFRNWIAENKDDILLNLNRQIFLEDWKKYAQGTFSSWEMEALCFYYHQHELAHINTYMYGIVDFFKLPTEPIVERTYVKNNKEIHLFKLFKICGTCIAKNKTKATVTLLTTSGVVEVKFRKEYFSLFDKQISQKKPDGTKNIIERSWFNRGSMIVVMGIRSNDNFIAKKYSTSNGHQLYKIDSVLNNGNLILRNSRAQGDEEESD